MVCPLSVSWRHAELEEIGPVVVQSRGENASLGEQFARLMSAARSARSETASSTNSWASPTESRYVCVPARINTETADLDSAVIEVSGFDAATEVVLLGTLVDPGGIEIASDAHAVHGLAAADLVDAPR
ncbi:hypothetical protein BDB13_5672 [Rhodococcus sp. OK302]|nr:hypothetical protein BDB13_5672 [Rhodococcus sp. OK302]